MNILRKVLGQKPERVEKIDRLEQRASEIEEKTDEALKEARHVTSVWWREIRHADGVLVGPPAPRRKRYVGGHTHA